MPQRKTIAKNKVTDANISHVHMTGSPAVPDATFVLLKSMDQEALPDGYEAIEKTSLFKTDSVKRQAFGYCLVPDIPDFQGDVIDKTNVEDACHSLMKNLLAGTADGEGSGVDHKVFNGGYPIESCIDYDGSIAKAHGAEGIPGGWWLGVQVTDDAVWGQIEKGTLKAFTVGGKGKRTPIAKSEPGPAIEDVGLFKMIRELFRSNRIAKADGEAESYAEVSAEEELMSKLWKMFWNLQDALMSIIKDDTVTDKVAPITQSIDQFKGDFTVQVQALQTAKANANNNNGVQKKHETKGDSDMTPDQLKDLTSTLTALTKSVAELSAKLTPEPGPDDKSKTPEEVKRTEEGTEEEKLKKTLDGLQASVTELTDRITKMEKTPQPRRGTSEPDSIKKTEGEEDELAKSAAGTAFDFGTGAAK